MRGRSSGSRRRGREHNYRKSGSLSPMVAIGWQDSLIQESNPETAAAENEAKRHVHQALSAQYKEREIELLLAVAIRISPKKSLDGVLKELSISDELRTWVKTQFHEVLPALFPGLRRKRFSHRLVR